VGVPLSEKAIDGSPCDSALTAADLVKFIGSPDQTKSNGLSDAYQNVKPTAVHWEELEAVQGYPTVDYRAAGDVDTAGVDHCQVVVGISNSLAYSVGITLSELPKSKGVNPCSAAKAIAGVSCARWPQHSLVRQADHSAQDFKLEPQPGRISAFRPTLCERPGILGTFAAGVRGESDMADDGTGFLSAFTFTVAGAAGAVGAAAAAAGAAATDAAASAGGGGFTMSKDEMTSMLTKAKGTFKLIDDQLRDAAQIAQIDPPGDDVASGEFTTVAVQSGNAYLNHLSVQRTRYQQLIAKLENALGLTVDTEDQAGQAVQQAGTEGKY
jgi:hypothetical protein